ncbi:MAG: hypothetical protein ACI90U_001369 [Pseudomonadales bacterium]|jgi:hypothetical protein
MILARVLLIFNGLFYAVYGTMCFVDPTTAANLVGFSLGYTSGPVEVMAMYGGMQLAIGFYSTVKAKDALSAPHGLEVLAVLMGGLGIARLIGLTIYSPDSYNLTIGCYEVCVCLLAIYARKRLLTKQ